jgi:hypothetical protein
MRHENIFSTMLNVTNIFGGLGLYSSDVVHGPVAGFYTHANEPARSAKGRLM